MLNADLSCIGLNWCVLVWLCDGRNCLARVVSKEALLEEMIGLEEALRSVWRRTMQEVILEKAAQIVFTYWRRY
jgi:hypothetical protein